MITHLANILKIFLNLAGFFLLLSSMKKVRTLTVPLLTFSGIAVFLFPFTLFGKGDIGISLLRVLNLLSAVIALTGRIFPRMFSRSERKPLKEILMPWVLFFAICGIIAVLSSRWFYTNWDEFDNYNMVVNSLLKFGKKLPTVTHPEYPYGAALVEYYLCKVSGFNEHIMLFICGMIFFSAILFTAAFAKRPLLRGLILSPISVMLVYEFGYSFYGFPTAMLDAMIGVVFAALLCLILNFPKRPDLYDWVQFVVLGAFFIQIKDVCAAFILVAFLLLLIRRWITLPKETRFADIRHAVIFCTISCIPYLIWFAYIKINGITRGHALGNITLDNLKLLASGDNVQRLSLKLFFQHTFDLPLGTCGITIFGLFLTLFAIVHISQFFGDSKEKVWMNTVLFVGAMGYTIYVGLVYIFVLDGKYPTTFDEYERFILSYLLGWTLPVLNFIWDGMDERAHEAKWIYRRSVGLVVLFYILAKAPYQDMLHVKEQDPAWIQAKRFYQEKNNILEDDREYRIFSLTQGIMPQTMLRSLFVGEESMISDFSFDLDLSGLNAPSLREYLDQKEVNTLYVYRPDEEFWNEFNELFESLPENIGKYHVYEQNNNGVWREISAD